MKSKLTAVLAELEARHKATPTTQGELQLAALRSVLSREDAVADEQAAKAKPAAKPAA